MERWAVLGCAALMEFSIVEGEIKSMRTSTAHADEAWQLVCSRI